MLRHAEFCIVMFFVLLMVFGWPFIAIPGVGAPRAMYTYLFAVWGIGIGLLMLIGRQNGERREPDGE
jgi:hypothetical protein